MKLTERFRRLTLWNKIAFVGSVASVIGVFLTVMQWLASPNVADVVSHSRDLNTRTRKAKPSQEFNQAVTEYEKELDSVTFHKTYTGEIHPARSAFRFRVEVFSVKPRGVALHHLRVLVTRGDETEPFQTIEPPEPADTSLFDALSDEDEFFVIEDLNFDGHRDIRYLLNQSQSGYEYRCYRYDPYNGIFVHDEQLEEIYGNYSELVINSSIKEVVRYIRCELDVTLKKVYRFEGIFFHQTASFVLYTSTNSEEPTFLEATCQHPVTVE